MNSAFECRIIKENYDEQAWDLRNRARKLPLYNRQVISAAVSDPEAVPIESIERDSGLNQWKENERESSHHRISEHFSVLKG